MVNGRLQRGVPSDGNFQPRTGAGYVAPFPGDYARAQKAGVEARALLVEPSGACGPELVQLLKDAAEWRSNKRSRSTLTFPVRCPPICDRKILWSWRHKNLRLSNTL